MQPIYLTSRSKQRIAVLKSASYDRIEKRTRFVDFFVPLNTDRTSHYLIKIKICMEKTSENYAQKFIIYIFLDETSKQSSGKASLRQAIEYITSQGQKDLDSTAINTTINITQILKALEMPENIVVWTGDMDVLPQMVELLSIEGLVNAALITDITEDDG